MSDNETCVKPVDDEPNKYEVTKKGGTEVKPIGGPAVDGTEVKPIGGPAVDGTDAASSDSYSDSELGGGKPVNKKRGRKSRGGALSFSELGSSNSATVPIKTQGGKSRKNKKGGKKSMRKNKKGCKKNTKKRCAKKGSKK